MREWEEEVHGRRGEGVGEGIGSENGWSTKGKTERK